MSERELSRPAIGFIIAAAIVTLLLWNLPILNIVFYPFKLFVTFVHETSHGLAAILTGGYWDSFMVSPDGSGVAHTSGGFESLIVSAGYLGSSVFGALMLIAATRRGLAQSVLFLVGAGLGFFTLVYARGPLGIISFGFVTGLLLSAALLYIACVSTGRVASLFLAFLAVQNCLFALDDLKTLLFLSMAWYPLCPRAWTDAHIMSWEISGGIVPPVVWAGIWAVIALVIFVKALRVVFGLQEKQQAA